MEGAEPGEQSRWGDGGQKGEGEEREEQSDLEGGMAVACERSGE